jgi:hypothetical protein
MPQITVTQYCQELRQIRRTVHLKPPDNTPKQWLTDAQLSVTKYEAYSHKQK